MQRMTEKEGAFKCGCCNYTAKHRSNLTRHMQVCVLPQVQRDKHNGVDFNLAPQLSACTSQPPQTPPPLLGMLLLQQPPTRRFNTQ